MRKWLAVSILALAASDLSGQEQSSQKTEIYSLLRDAGTLLPLMPDYERSTMATEIARSQAHAGEMQEGVRTAEAAGDERPYALQAVLIEVTNHGDANAALQIVRASKDTSVIADGLWGIAGVLARQGDFARAVAVADLIPRDHFSDWANSLVFLCTLQRRAGQDEAAEALLKRVLTRLRDKVEDPAVPYSEWRGVYGATVRRLLEMGDADAAREVVYSMRDITESEQDPKHREQMTAETSRTAAYVGDYGTAEEMASRLPAGSLRDWAYSSLSLRLSRNSPNQALQVTQNISAQNMRDNAMGGIVDAQALSGNYAGALDVIQAESAEKRAVALGELANILAQHGDPAAEYTIALAMEAIRETPPGYVEEVLGSLALAKAKLGDFDGALALLGEISGDWKARVMGNVTRSMVSAGVDDQARGLAEGEADPYVKANALLGIADGLLEQQERND